VSFHEEWLSCTVDTDLVVSCFCRRIQAEPRAHTRHTQQLHPIPPRTSSRNFLEKPYAAGAYALSNPYALEAREKRRLREQMESQSGHVGVKEEQLHSLEIMVHVTKKEKEELVSQMERVSDTMTRMQAQMDAVTEERDKFEKTNKELRSELVGGRMEKRHWIDDDYLVSKWKELDSLVRQITAIRFGDPQPMVVKDSRRLFGDLVDDQNVWLMGENRSWLIHAFIWSTLVDRVFGEGGFSESGYTVTRKAQDSVESLLRTLRGKHVPYYRLMEDIERVYFGNSDGPGR
jgi:hypothetical protein